MERYFIVKNETKSFDGDLKAYAEIIDNVGEKAVKALRNVLEDM